MKQKTFNNQELSILRDLIKQEGKRVNKIVNDVLNRLETSEYNAIIELLRKDFEHFETYINILNKIDSKLWQMEQQ